MMPIFERRPMSHPDHTDRIRRALIAGMALVVLSGCAGALKRPDPLTTEDIVRLVKAETPSPDIIQRLRETRTVLPLTGSQFAKLREQGVPDDVLDHLQQAYLGAVEFDARMRYQGLYWGGWGPPFPYPGFRGPLPYWYYW
jgi:hypothetical protein